MSRARSRPNTPTHWNIRAVMRDRGITSSRALARLLVKFTDISEDQVRRLVAGKARRPPPFDVLNALCYVLGCGITDLMPINHRKFDPTALAADGGSGRPKTSKALKRNGGKTPKIRRLGNPDGVLPFPIDF